MCQSSRVPPHESFTVGAAGPPYTYMSTGCFTVLSKFAATTRIASSFVPSGIGIWKNSVRTPVPLSFAASAELSAITRRLVNDGRS
jgi:hypothetical protein